MWVVFISFNFYRFNPFQLLLLKNKAKRLTGFTKTGQKSWSITTKMTFINN
ncbi:hypothetical protein NC99_10970 [Sunxiuqinia dokdonensis]|uniref:Uncharacterized protein n=1 Tax=Sunxiuqinia dokdonensis TaxID=1409788 RepID=A0A0L8VD16_9BACT|nr:hypothetical protein NC99_10970 [Sunxiuqinia dokdonensis]